jgi:hypothetical protein
MRSQVASHLSLECALIEWQKERALAEEEKQPRSNWHYLPAGRVFCRCNCCRLTAESVQKWLAAHPETELVSRERGGAYADGAARRAPQAEQITTAGISVWP